MREDNKTKFPIKVTMPPGLMKSSHSGKTYIVAGCMIPVPDDTKFEDMHKYVTYSPPRFDAETWKVKSSSGNSTYTVTLRKGSFSCDCTGFKFYKKCKHVKKIAGEKQAS